MGIPRSEYPALQLSVVIFSLVLTQPPPTNGRGNWAARSDWIGGAAAWPRVGAGIGSRAGSWELGARSPKLRTCRPAERFERQQPKWAADFFWFAISDPMAQRLVNNFLFVGRARDLCALCALSWRGTGPSVCVSYVIWGPSCPSRGPMPRFRFWFRFRNQGDTAIFPKCSQLGKSAANLRNKTHKSTPREILEGPKAKAKEKEEQAPGTRQQAAVSKSIIKAKMAPLVLALPIPGKHTQNGTRHSQCIVHGK